jgi:hypothetical protein
MIRFMYLRDVKQNPVGCLAISIIDGKITYGLSVLNPLDKFDRKLARRIAVGRLTIAPMTVPGIEHQLSMHTISSLVMRHLADNVDLRKIYVSPFEFTTHFDEDGRYYKLVPVIPTRVSKAAKLWLNSNSR